VDPLRHANLTKPQSWNQYSYAANDPVNLADPSGRDPLPIFYNLDSITHTESAPPGLDPADEFALMEFFMGGDPVQQKPKEEFAPDPVAARQMRQMAATLNRIYAAIPAAISALKSNPICSALFNLQGNAPDPATLLTEIASGLFAGAYFTVGETDPDANAETYRTPYSTGPDGTIGWTPVVGYAVTVFNYDPNTPFNNGTVTANATTILHELGHIYGYLYGLDSTMIGYDYNNAALSRSNTATVSSVCFGGQ